MSKKLPPRFERVFKKLFIEPCRGMTRRLREDVPPQTAIRRMETATQRAADRLSKGDLEAFVPDLIEMIRAAPEQEVEIEVPAATTDAETAVFAVFDSLDQVLPRGTIALLTMMVGVHRPARLATWYETRRIGLRVGDARGEERAIQLRNFAWQVLEYEYVPFLHVLLQAAWIANGKSYRPSNSIGDLVNEVKQRGLLGGLLWTDARHVRNAASHRLGWTPDLDQGTVILHDVLRDGSEWTQPFDVDDLFEKLLDLADMTDTFAAALHRAFARDLLIPMTGPLIRAIRTGAEDPILNSINNEFTRSLLHARGKMLQQGWTFTG